MFAHFGDADAFVEGRQGVLFGGEHFFVEFFAGPQAGVFDLDVFVGREAGQGDHPAGELVDLHGFAHIEDEDLVAGAHRGGLHHEAAGLGDGHKEAVDLGVRDGHRAALGDLLAEARDHGAVAAEDVAEAGGHELGRAGLLAIFDGEAEALDVDFGQALGAAHNVGGVHGLVGGDHHHFLDAVFHAFVGHVLGAIDVHEDGFARVFFHQGHVLVGGGVEDDLRVPRAEREVEPLGVPHVADDGHEVEVFVFVFQLEANVVHRRLGIVVEHEFLDAEAGELAHELRADGAGGAGHHHDLVFEIGLDLVERDHDLFAAQQVFDLDGARMEQRLPVDHLIDVGHDERLDVVARAVRNQAVDLLPRIGVAREEDGLHAVAAHDPLELLPLFETIDRQTLDDELVFRLVGRQEAHDLVVRGVAQACERGHALVGRIVDQHRDLVVELKDPFVEPPIHDDHRNADAQQEHGGEQHIEDHDEQGPVRIAAERDERQQHDDALAQRHARKTLHVAGAQVPDDDTECPEQEEKCHRSDDRRRQIDGQQARGIEHGSRQGLDAENGDQRSRQRKQDIDGKNQLATEVGVLEECNDSMDDPGWVFRHKGLGFRLYFYLSARMGFVRKS